MIVVYTILINWNGKKDTFECLRSLSNLVLSDIDHRIIVIDNASSDGLATELPKRFPQVIMLPQGANLGFSGGNNVGIDWAFSHGADYIWILNNDTTVDRHALVSLVSEGKRSKVGVCGSKIYFTAGREFHASRYTNDQQGKVIWYAGGVINWNNVYATHRGVDEVDHGQYDRPRETDFVTGCSMFIPRETLEKIGRFDLAYFMYLEDVDFCVRARRAGLRLIFVPASVVWHKNAGSTGATGNDLQTYYIRRNRILFGMKYAPVRAKFALAKESVKDMFDENQHVRQAIKDAFFMRFGERVVWKK